MRAYYYDNLPGPGSFPHDSNKPVDKSTLDKLGVFYWPIPVDDRSEVDKIAEERGYRNRDVIKISREALGEEYEPKTTMFFNEHMHEDEEIRYILEGSGYFDVREHATDAWIRIAMEAGDMIVLPAGIYHRFTLDRKAAVRTLRLFKDEPKWTAHSRGEDTDVSPVRMEYLKSVGVAA